MSPSMISSEGRYEGMPQLRRNSYHAAIRPLRDSHLRRPSCSPPEDHPASPRLDDRLYGLHVSDLRFQREFQIVPDRPPLCILCDIPQFDVLPELYDAAQCPLNSERPQWSHSHECRLRIDARKRVLPKNIPSLAKAVYLYSDIRAHVRTAHGATLRVAHNRRLARHAVLRESPPFSPRRTAPARVTHGDLRTCSYPRLPAGPARLHLIARQLSVRTGRRYGVRHLFVFRSGCGRGGAGAGVWIPGQSMGVLPSSRGLRAPGRAGRPLLPRARVQTS